MQDWELEVADGSRITEFIDFYENGLELSEAERESLLELILFSYEDGLEQASVAPEAEEALEKLLVRKGALHRNLLEYWAQGTEEDCFLPRPLIVRVKRQCGFP